ncbi:MULTISPECIES: PepSY-associated TM helix domain-containing protein [Corynebacterium]|uniref:PepSY-associated TM helix domain-containing protein n=1 Tax=Corynebacterium TaxID=1716 RepID=UPI001EF307FE|nr:PepSY domain-containing protein [Corynebacterium kefirresidentii]MCG7240340.1 PepSY domain-containing protein [Corynebacterium kefirresidentii]MCG7282506.1 PepSY domain-containing protein [Corynebacterium kefirresidentii]
MTISTHGALSRLHKFAGVIIAPFLIVAALSGFLYALAPTFEPWIYHDEVTATAQGSPRSLDEQIAAAQRQHPDGTVVRVEPSEDPQETTRVLFDDSTAPNSSYTHAVFVDPVDLHITGELQQYGGSRALPFRTWASNGHRTLWLGEPGRLYAELAASWLGALSILGLYLWLKRKQRNKKQPSKVLALHARVGAWLLPGFLFLTVTGLTWSLVAGTSIGKVREELNWKEPSVATSVAEAGASTGAGEHANHAEHVGHAGHAGHTGNHDAAELAGAQTAESTARSQGLTGVLEMTPPEKPGDAWGVREARAAFKLRSDAVAVIPNGEVIDRINSADWPLAAQLTSWLIQLHMGTLFGIYSQIALAVLALGLLVVSIAGLWMWWKKPRRSLPELKITPAVLAGVVAYSIIAPLFGVSLLLFFVGDWIVRRLRAPKQDQGAAAGEVTPRPRGESSSRSLSTVRNG